MNIWLFLIATLVIGWFSRRSLMSPRSHGFYRFFAWESIILLVLLNLSVWFYQPFTWHQIISWVCLMGSLIVAIIGFQQLIQLGHPDDTRLDDTLIGLEKTTKLVTTGIYRFIRHPLYSSLLLLAVGAFFKQPGWLGAFLTALAAFFLTLTAQAEEQENIAYFGQNYLEYRSGTKMFIPFIF
jgi:protein-S-isoprenylcysteine O-methyltransferase Ste14